MRFGLGCNETKRLLNLYNLKTNEMPGDRAVLGSMVGRQKMSMKLLVRIPADAKEFSV